MPRSADAAARRLLDIWAPLTDGALRSVTVVAADWWPGDGGPVPHDRHVRFDAGVAITVPAGLDRFARRTIQPTQGVEWAYRWKPKSLAKLTMTEDRIVTSRGAQQAIAYDTRATAVAA